MRSFISIFLFLFGPLFCCLSRWPWGPSESSNSSVWAWICFGRWKRVQFVKCKGFPVPEVNSVGLYRSFVPFSFGHSFGSVLVCSLVQSFIAFIPSLPSFNGRPRGERKLPKGDESKASSSLLQGVWRAWLARWRFRLFSWKSSAAFNREWVIWGNHYCCHHSRESVHWPLEFQIFLAFWLVCDGTNVARRRSVSLAKKSDEFVAGSALWIAQPYLSFYRLI